MASNTVPFKLDSVYGGFGECDGLLRDDGDHLTLEFQIRDAIAGILKSGVRRIEVPLKEVVSVTLTRGWLGMSWLGVKIILQVARMEMFSDLPTASQGRIEFRIARKDRPLAEKFVADLYESEAPSPTAQAP